MKPEERDRLKLKYIEKERKMLLSDIRVAQSRIAELNRQRQNIIMGMTDGQEAGECVCRTCGDLFNESELTTIQYAEYAGASMQEEYASPCCHGNWDYTDTE